MPMSDKLHEDVRHIVDEIFKKNEEAQMRKETQDALEKSANTINELSDSLEAKEAELANVKEQITKLEETTAGLENTIEEMKKAQETFEAEKASFDSEKEELNKKLEEANKALEDIKKDQMAAARMNELEEAKVANKNKDSQLSKVREMTDEEFAAYKEELVSIKESIMAEIESNSNSDNNNTNQDTANQNSASPNGDDNENASGTDVEENYTMSPSQAAMAAMNMEFKPNSDLMKKYSDLGKAMAAKYTEGRK